MKPKENLSVGEAVAKALADGTATEGVGVRIDGEPAYACEAGKKRCGGGKVGKRQKPTVTEAEFRRQVIDYARRRGWKVAAIRPVRVQRASGEVYYETPMEADGCGWPDLVLIRAGVLIVAELKVGRNRATPEQVAWLDAFRDTGCASGVWRPESWPDILKTLE